MAHLTHIVSYVEIDVPHCSLTYSQPPCTAFLGVGASQPILDESLANLTDESAAIITDGASALSGTGTIKCFNSLGTCQDRPNFTDAPVTMIFGEDENITRQEITLPTEADEILTIEAGIGAGAIAEIATAGDSQTAILGLPPPAQLSEMEVFPFIKTIDFTPAIVSLGEDLGQRASLKVTFRDAPHSDAGVSFDKYADERPYIPFAQGTFWGKFRARNPYLRGRSIRLKRGTSLQELAEMETHHFVIDSFDGPTPDGLFTITGKDILKFADGDRAQAPLLSNGFLAADITDVAGSLTLSPVGVGNAEYPASGHAAIGGKEVVSFTRAADVMTITRAQLNTEGVAHSAQDRVQLILRYVGQDPADIIADLLINYAGIDSNFIPLDDWQAETGAFLGVVYTLNIAEPTGVNSLVSELIQQMGAAIWWDDQRQLINLQILRSIPTTAQRYNEDVVLGDTLDVSEQPNKRVSQVILYFAQINPLLKIDELSNYRSTQTEVDTQSELDEGSAAIKKIYARGIAAGGRSVATRVAQKYLSRYVRPPRRFNFELLRFSTPTPQLAQGIRLGGGAPDITSWPFQDETGAPVDVPIQITRHDPRDDRHVIEAEEMLFTAFGDDIDPTVKSIIIDVAEFGINMRTRHDELYGVPISGDTVTCYISTGVIVGSFATDIPAFHVGDWPAGVTLALVVAGRIEGTGGHGAAGGFPYGPENGEAGGLALYTRESITVTLTTGAGEIWGGGGGGGNTNNNNRFIAGAGGAGQYPGQPGAPVIGQQAGTTEAGGLGYQGTAGTFSPPMGQGGDPGDPGVNGNPPNGGSGGAAGVAIDGVSFCTISGGDIRGTQIN